MEILRNRTAIRIFSLSTVVIFLNMSFFLAGISLLTPENRQIIENVGNIVLNEEEREGHNSGTEVEAKLFPLFSDDVLLSHFSLFLTAEKLQRRAESAWLRDGHSENFSPPPDIVVELARNSL